MATDTLYTLLVAFVTIVAILYGLRLLVNVAVRGIHMRVGRISPWSFRNFEWNYWVQIMDDQYEQTGIRQTKVPTRLKGSKRRLFQIRIGRVGIRIRPSFAQLKQLVFGRASPSDPDSDPERSKIHLPPNVENIWLSLIVQDVVIHIDRIGWIVAYLKRKKSRQQEANKEPGARTSTIRRLTAKLPKIPMTTIAGAITYPLIMLWPVQFTLTIFTQIVKLISAIPAQFFISGLANYVDVRIIGIRVEIGQAGTTDGHDQTCNERGFTLTLSGIRIGSVLYSDLLRTRVVGKASNTSTGNAMPTLATHELPVSKSPRSSLNISGAGGESDYPTAATTDTDVSDGHSGVPTNNARSNVARQSQSKRYHQHSNTESHQQHSLKNTRHLFRDKLMEVGLLIGPVELTLTDDNAQRPKNRSHSTPLSPFHLPNPTTFLVLCHLSATCTTLKGVSIEAVFDTFKSNLDTVMRIVEPIKKASKSKQESSHSEGNFPSPSIPSERPLSKDNHQADQSPTSTSIPQIPDPFNDSHAAKHAIASRRSKRWIDSVGISLHRVHLDFSGMNDVVKERLDKATSRQEAGETEFPSANHLPWPAFHLQFSSLIARAILKRSRRGKSTFFGNQDDLKVNGANVSSIYVGYDIAHDALPELNTWDQHDIEGDDIYRNSETESSKREAMHAIWSAQMSLASLDITPTSAIADRAHCPSKSSWFSISSFSVSCQHLRRPKPIAKRSLGVLRRPRRLSLRWEGNPELHSGPTTPDGQNHFAWSQLASPSNEVWRPDMARFEPQPTIQTPIPAPNPSIHNPNDNLYLFSLDTKSTHINIDASYITQLQAISRSKSATTGNTSSTYPTNFVKSKVSKTLSNLPRIAARARLCNSAIVLHYGPRYKAENIPQQPPNQPTFPYLDAVVFSSHSIVLNASGRYRPPMVSSSLIRSQSLADGLHISGLTNESILPPIQGIPQTPIDSPNPTNLDSLIDMQLLSAPPSSEPFTYPINDEHRPYSPPSASLSTPSSPPLSVAQTPVQADNQSPSPTLQVAQKTMPDAAPSRRKSRWSFKPSLRFFNRGTPSGTQGSLSSEASKLVTACDAHSYHMDFSIQLESINLAMKGPEDTTSPLGRDKEDSKKCSLFQLGSFRVNCGISAKSSEETGDTTNKLSLFDRLRFKKSAYLDPGSWTTYLSSQSSKLTLVVNMDDLLVDFTGSDGAPTLADIELLRTSVLPQTKTRSKGEQKRTSDKRYINPLTRDILGILDAQLIISHVIVRFAGIDKENTTEPPAGMLNSAPQHGSISAGLQLSVPNSMVRWIGRSIPSEKSTSVPTQSTQLAEPDQVGAIKTNTSSIVLLPLLLDAKKHLIVLDPGKIVEAHRQACGCVSISDLTITSTIDSTNSVLSPSNQITATTDVGNVYTVYTLPFHYCTLIALASLSDLLSSPKGREREIPQTQATNDAKTEFKHQLSFSLTAFKLRANIPGGLVLLLSVTMLKADSGAIERPISFEQLRLQGVSALQKDSWVDLVCIDTVKVYTPQKTETSEHASADQESKLSVSAALFHLRIPYKYVYADIVDYGVNLFKTIKSLHNRIVAKKEFLIDGPIVQDDPVKIACIAFQLARLEMEIEDDPFECKLSTNWKLGLEEQKARLARLAAYQQKIEELAAQAEYPARADNLGELMTASPSLGPAHRSDSVTSLNSLCTAASEPILPSSGLADEKVRPGVRHRLSAHSAKQRLDEYDSKSWIRIIQLDSGYFQSTSPVAKQGDHIQQRDSQRSFKEFLEDACFNGEVQPRPSAPPLLRMAFDRMHLRISPPTFDLANTRRFMHDVGNGVPLDTHFSTLIPVRLEIRCGRTIATLRDYPLPLLHVPSCQNEGAGNVESWRLQGDYCFGDEIGDEGAIGHVNTVIISKAFASTYAAFNYEVTIPRCPSPPKFYSVVHIEVVTPRPTRLAWSVSVQPAIQDVSKIFDTITRPPIDPSPKVGFWDKIRLMIHSRTQIDFVGGGDFVFSLKGSRDPYAFTGRAAGVTKTWKKDACIRVGFKNVESELIQIYSSSYLLSVPNLSKDDWIYTASSDDKTMKNGWTVNSETIGDDAVSTSHKSPIANDLPQDDELAAKLEEYGLVNDIYDKVILKLNGAVRWGIGAHFERTCLRGCKVCGGRFQCRSQSFRPHYDIKYLTPASAAKRYVETGRMNDAFEGFRSDFIHFAVGVSGTSATPNERNSLTFQNSMHLSSKFLSHFLQLWRLFGGEMSLPIRAGNLFPRADPRPNLKFGKKLSTMKFIIHVQPLNLAYILKEDDFQTMESAVVEGGGDAVGLKGRADSFGVDVHMRREWRTVDTPHLGERVKPSWPIHEAEINVTDADLRAIRANYYSSGRDWQGTILGDFEDDVTDGTTNAIRRGSNSEANEATWLDFDDFVELDLRPPEFRPKVQILPLMYTPHVGYIKQNDPQNAEKWAYLNKTHPCIMGKSPDPKAFQMSCLKQRAQAIDDAITEIQEALSNLESKLKLSPYNSQLLEESDTYIEKLSNLLDRRGLLQQCLKSVGGRTPIRRRSTITSPTTPVFEKDFSVSWEDYFGHFEQRYIIQNPKIIWNNALRNLLYHFLDLQVQQRAQTYYLSMRAVKFLRDLTAKASRGSTLNSDLPNTSETDQGFDERMAQELIEKLMSDPNTIAENESQQGQNGTQSNKDGEQMVINDPASQNDSIPDGFTMESNYLVQLLNPQIILQSEKALDAIILMAADGVQIKAFDILDDSISADDYDNQLVKKRTIFSMENTQFFVAHKADFRNERILFDDHYAFGGHGGGGSQFQRIANKSSASAQYDAYNPLRLKSINKKPNRFGTNLVPFSERSNSVFIRFPTLFLNANSDQFTVIYEVVSDLLLYKEPARKERLDRLQEILLAADVDHLANGSETVGYLQDQIRFFEELLVHYREMVGSLDEAQLDDYRMIKSSFVQTREELYLMMEAITKAQDQKKENLSDPKTNMKITFQSNEFIWVMMQDSEHPLCEWILSGAHFGWVSKEDHSKQSTLEIDQFRLLNKLEKPVFVEMIAPYLDGKKHVNFSRQKMLRGFLHDLPPVGGISVVQHLEINLFPLKFQMTYDFGKQLIAYIFPEKRKQQKAADPIDKPLESTSADLTIHSGQSLRYSNGSQFDMAHLEIAKLGMAKSPESQPSKVDPLIRQESSSSFQLPLRGSQASTGETTNDNVSSHQFSTDQKRSGKKVAGRLSSNSNDLVEKSDELSLMKSRASQNRTFIYIKIPGVPHCLSYQGPKEKNIEDLYDFVFRQPTLEYRNKTWTYLEFLNQVKKDILRAALAHSGALIKEKFRQRRQHRPENLESPVILSPGHVGIVSKEQIHTKRSLELLEEADEAGSMENETFEASTEDKDKPKGKSGLLSRLLKKESPKATPDVSLVGSEPDSPTSERRNSHPDPQREEEEYREKGRLLLGKFYIAPSAYSASRRSSQSTSSIRSFE
ncbi:hypothetical protein BZG36_02198 [Bifiguratus adelaidae]|uniref:FMP27 GFWDK domain-containing protein n=1 Tax=Bifiguratus adelaidae TaxID=1938954 RepID=A0A261Y3K8_9FUNG|nr:hypothetical protein BZG36_02198 [Bifiguratus adelaidae]